MNPRNDLFFSSPIPAAAAPHSAPPPSASAVRPLGRGFVGGRTAQPSPFDFVENWANTAASAAPLCTNRAPLRVHRPTCRKRRSDCLYGDEDDEGDGGAPLSCASVVCGVPCNPAETPRISGGNAALPASSIEDNVGDAEMLALLREMNECDALLDELSAAAAVTGSRVCAGASSIINNNAGAGPLLPHPGANATGAGQFHPAPHFDVLGGNPHNAAVTAAPGTFTNPSTMGVPAAGRLDPPPPPPASVGRSAAVDAAIDDLREASKARIQLQIEAQADRVRRHFLEAARNTAVRPRGPPPTDGSSKRRRSTTVRCNEVSGGRDSRASAGINVDKALKEEEGSGGGGRGKRSSMIELRRPPPCVGVGASGPLDGGARRIFQSGLGNYYRGRSSFTAECRSKRGFAFEPSSRERDSSSVSSVSSGGDSPRRRPQQRGSFSSSGAADPSPAAKRGSIRDLVLPMSSLLSDSERGSDGGGGGSSNGSDGSGTSAGPNSPRATFVTKNDVICGSGMVTESLVGNRRYGVLVDLHARSYSKALGDDERRDVVRSVVRAVRGAVPPGRFLRLDVDSPGCGLGLEWREVGDDGVDGAWEHAEADLTRAARGLTVTTVGGKVPLPPVARERSGRALAA